MHAHFFVCLFGVKRTLGGLTSQREAAAIELAGLTIPWGGTKEAAMAVIVRKPEHATEPYLYARLA